MSEITEGHPIWDTIDRGGGQCCDIDGVLRELDKAGFVIISKDEIERLQAEGAAFRSVSGCIDAPLQSFADVKKTIVK
jgi:hypothetical protein